MTGLSQPNPRLAEWSEALIEEGLAQDAVILLDRALQFRPDDADLRLALVRALWASDDAARTARAVSEALPHVRVDGDRSWLLGVQALSLVALERNEEAVKAALDATRLSRDKPAVLFAQAIALAAGGRVEEARGTANRLLKLSPDLPHGHVAMAATASGRREVEEHFRRALELEADDEHLVLSLGRVLLARGENRWAVDILRDATRHFPLPAAGRQLAETAAARLEGRRIPLALFVLAAVGLLLRGMSGGRLAWVANIVFGVSLVLLAVHRWRLRGLPLEASVVTESIRAEGRRLGLAVRMTLAGFLVALPVLWVLILGIPASREGWAEIHWFEFVIAGLIAALGLWLLWRIRQARRLGPRLIRGTSARCRCADVSVLTAADARVYGGRHLRSTSRDGSFPDVLTCPDTGRLWIRYAVRLGRGPAAQRLVRLPLAGRQGASVA